MSIGISIPRKKRTHMNILHIDSSPRGAASHSRQVSGELVTALKAAHQDAIVTYRDLGHQPPPFVTEDWQHGAYTPEEERTPAQRAALRYSDEVIAELLAADIIVAGVPMYNLSIPADFKAWIDQVVRINKTFTAGYEGLATGKRMFVVTARGGGGYGAGEERETYNYQDPYLRAVFGFIGITDVNFIHVNNTARGEEAVRESIGNARAAIEQALAA